MLLRLYSNKVKVNIGEGHVGTGYNDLEIIQDFPHLILHIFKNYIS